MIKKGDRFWDSWMERSDRPLGFGMGKAIAVWPVLIDADTESSIAL
ncbi:hypothetical protein [Microcoleus sp. PH2017_05_CCC_O_A]|nr:hypothetical protein [Microcoleus sp. PH2017_05_CCC_O_A]MCC3437241.1 hypothetical protein [Microcoleus sp. PH2017_05_CCC_O_A]